MDSKGIALVTGAGQGIGREIALRLADDGFDVAVNDISANAEKLIVLVEEIKAKGRGSSAHVADVSIEEQVKKMVADVVEAQKGLDVMVANAGVCKYAKLVDTTVDEWDRMMSINARGAFLCYKYAGIQMISQGRGGRIIGASSITGKQNSSIAAAYGCSKFAVRGLTQAAAQEFGPHGITVNAYAPGAVETDMMAYLDRINSEQTGAPSGTIYKMTKNATALKMTGKTVDIANLVSFIASKESSFITGQSISINGGSFFD